VDKLSTARGFSDANLSRELDEAVSTLERLNIMSRVPEPPTPRAYQLQPIFAKSLRNALTGGGTHKSFGLPFDVPVDEQVDVEYLDRYARGQWEAILFFMVGTTGVGLTSDSTISDGTKTLLEQGNFVARAHNQVSITKEGFTFLLQEANTQVWTLLIVYLEFGETVRDRPTASTMPSAAPSAHKGKQANYEDSQLSMDLVDMLSFYFMLGSLELGQAYSISSLSPTQTSMLDDLSDFGIVYRPSNDAPYFYPTRLATTLTSDAGALPSSPSSALTSSASKGKGYIILETNHRIYAYTSSLLQIAVLNLFTKLTTRFANLVSGKLTKESVQRAISYGITSDQIISYLQTHAHSQMYKSDSSSVLPPTVVDQIRLWQLERDRMKTTNGYLLREFSTWQEYEDNVKYAESLGVLAWRNDEKRMFFVTDIRQMQNYIRSRQNRNRDTAAS